VRLRLLLGVVCALAAASASAQWQGNGAAIPDEAWRKSDGDFGAMLLLTNRAQEFVAEWIRGQSQPEGPRLRTTAAAGRGDTVAAIILFTHCAPADTGMCRTYVDFKVLRPDGSTYATHRDVALWNGTPPRDDAVQIGNARLDFQIEPSDSLGIYEIHADVYDQVAQRKVSLVQTLAVSEQPAAK
jgi:hypothetical protein